MLKNRSNAILILALFSLLFSTSCNKEDAVTTEETTFAFTDASLSAIQRNASTGPSGCFEFVFPINIQFADGSTATANDYEELKATIMAWKEANPDAEGKPDLAFPFEVITQDGELVSLSDQSELQALKIACGDTGHKKKHRKCSAPCFEIVFPINITFPDDSTAEASDRMELKTLIRAWKEANPDATEKPELVFPIEVVLEADGSIVTVADGEELRALKEGC